MYKSYMKKNVQKRFEHTIFLNVNREYSKEISSFESNFVVVYCLTVLITLVMTVERHGNLASIRN